MARTPEPSTGRVKRWQEQSPERYQANQQRRRRAEAVMTARHRAEYDLLRYEGTTKGLGRHAARDYARQRLHYRFPEEWREILHDPPTS